MTPLSQVLAAVLMRSGGGSAVSLVEWFPVFGVNVMSPSSLIEQSKDSWNGKPLKMTALHSECWQP